MSLPSLPVDKANHALYGALIVAIVSPFNPWWALAAVVVAGVGKELLDWWQNSHRGANHGVEVADAAATIGGGLLVLIPQLVPYIRK